MWIAAACAMVTPLARAAHATSPESLRDRVRLVLASTTVADAESASASLTMSPTARILVADDWPAVTVTTTSDAQVVR